MSLASKKIELIYKAFFLISLNVANEATSQLD